MINRHLTAALARAAGLTLQPIVVHDLRRPDATVVRPLLPVQLDAVREMQRTIEPGPWGPRGLLGLIGCGHGKTLIAALAPTIYNAQRPLILVPASAYVATTVQIQEWASQYRIAPNLQIMSYERLSAMSGRDTLDALSPDLIVCDEAHCLGNAESARYRRLSRYVMGNRHCRVVVLSGTLIGRELASWAHLAFAALRDWSPLPAGRNELNHYANVLDHNGEPTGDDFEYLRDLNVPGFAERDKQGYQLGFRSLLQRTPGVVFASGASADVSLYLTPWDVRPACPRLDEARERLISGWELPDGTELVDTLELYRHERSLRLGFYTRWRPPTDDNRAEFDQFFRCRKAYSDALRDAFQVSSYDSIGEIEEAIRAGREGGHLWRLWNDWDMARQYEPPSEVVWLEGALPRLTQVIRAYQAEAPRDHVVWYSSRALEPVFASWGYTTHGAGSTPPFAGPSAASWLVHGKGWNGQAFSHALILEPPSNATQYEQLLARMHRRGQSRDVMTFWWLPYDEALEEYEKVRAEARHAQLLTGDPQRILYAMRAHRAMP